MGRRCLETALRPVRPPRSRASVRRAVRRSRTAPGTAEAMAGRQKEKVIPDEVHQNQILRELYLKELRTQKLYTQYHVNPLRKGEGRPGAEVGDRVGAPREGGAVGVQGGDAGRCTVGDAFSDLAPLPRFRDSDSAGGAEGLAPHPIKYFNILKCTHTAIK